MVYMVFDCFPMVSYGLYGFSYGFLWFSYGFPMVFLWYPKKTLARWRRCWLCTADDRRRSPEVKGVLRGRAWQREPSMQMYIIYNI